MPSKENSSHLENDSNSIQTLKKFLAKEDIERRISSQYETEIGRHLTSSEWTLLLERLKPECIWNKIEKV